MTIDEAIADNLRIAEGQDKCAEISVSEHAKERMKVCATEHRQIAEWLKDYKELKNSVGAVNLELLKEAQAELEKRGNMLHDAIAELEEAKRLLKSAITEWHIVCEWGDCGEYCGWYVNGKCSQKWSGEAEAFALIGDERNEP